MTNEELATKLDEEINHIHETIMKRVQADEIVQLTQALSVIISLKNMITD